MMAIARPSGNESTEFLSTQGEYEGPRVSPSGKSRSSVFVRWNGRDCHGSSGPSKEGTDIVGLIARVDRDLDLGRKLIEAARYRGGIGEVETIGTGLDWVDIGLVAGGPGAPSGDGIGPT